MAVALTALSATVHVQGTGGSRTLSMPGFHRLPGAEPQRDTNLEPGDLITAVELPPPDAAAANSGYRKVRERASFSFAVVSVAAALQVQDGVVEECRIALGGLAHVPWRATEAEAAVRGRPATQEGFEAAADAELARAEPLRDNAYKVPLTRNVLVTALTELAA
jgi:xanthine dehydrogenase YagS FAD-binding subunit